MKNPLSLYVEAKVGWGGWLAITFLFSITYFFRVFGDYWYGDNDDLNFLTNSFTNSLTHSLSLIRITVWTKDLYKRSTEFYLIIYGVLIAAFAG
jgi:hypothetical protein